MSQERSSDPFTEPYQQSVLPPGQAAASSAAPPAYGGAPAYGAPPAYGGGYSFGGGYGGGYGGAYSSAYSGGYGNPYGGYGLARPAVAPPLASGARATGALVLSGMHEAMARFARVSALIEEVLRHLHMLFDAVFGLGYSVGAFRQEAALWVAVKTGPVGYVARLLRRAANVWRLLGLFFMSPAAGRFSPVALVLRILGLVPEEDELQPTLAEMWSAQREAAGAEGESAAVREFNSHPLADSSNM